MIDTDYRILPGQELDGGTVIASVIVNDTDYEENVVMALLLMPVHREYWMANAAKLLRDLLPEWSAFKEEGETND